MNRRDFLAATPAALAATQFPAFASPLRNGSSGPRIVVIGAGIIGAAIAHRLALRGAQITLIERARPASGGTGGSFAWIMPRPVAGSPSLYDLYVAAVHGWRWLDDELAGSLAMRWGGYVGWQRPGPAAEAFAASVREQRALVAGTRAITLQELKALLPGAVIEGPTAAEVFAEDSGSLDPVKAVDILIERGRAAGLSVASDCEVIGFDVVDGRIRAVRTAHGRIEADEVVLAAGVDTSRLAALLGVRAPINAMAGSLAHTSPQPIVLDRAIAAPGAVIKQDADGRFVTGPAFSGAPNADTSVEYGRQLIAAAARVFPAIANAPLEHMSLGAVAVPPDAKPILGHTKEVANLYVAVTLSGVTFAPLFARYAASEIIDKVKIAALADFRPERFSAQA